MENGQELQIFNTKQFLNFCLGFFGLQFAWQMRVILSGPVTESLGASPFLFGLIWLAGPITGIIIQPIVGAISDTTSTKFGRRKPYIFLGAIFTSVALIIFPKSGEIASLLGKTFNIDLPIWTGLLIAAIMIWIIDACINTAQGPYRALIPDNIVPEQQSLANAYISFAIGLGSVIAAGTAPFLKWAFNYQMSIYAQFIMGAIAFSLAATWTCLTVKERQIEREITENKKTQTSFLDNFKAFFNSSPEIFKICLMQFFTWIGVMSLLIFFTQYITHTIFQIPDLTNTTNNIKASYEGAIAQATNFASINFAVFNLICFLIALPIGVLSSKFGNKRVHITSLILMALTFLGLSLTTNKTAVIIFMAVAGIGWASILSLPFAMLSEYIKKGSEGTLMGIFNIFIAGPQVLVCTFLAWYISKCEIALPGGMINYHWEYAFIIGAILLFISAFITNFIKEKN